MKFFILPPAQILTKYIRGYVFMEFYNELPQRKCSIPVGFPVMGICTENTPILLTSECQKQKTQNMLCGIIETPLILTNQGFFKSVMVVFQPLGVAQLFGIPQSLLLNRMVPLENLSLIKKYHLVEKIMESSGVKTIKELLDDFFYHGLINQKYTVNEIEYVVNKIYQYNGSLKIEALLADLDISLRTFERRFKQEIGFTPKKYLCQVRLQKLLKNLSLNPKIDIQDQIHQLGFYDQSHLIHNLKDSLGTSYKKIEPEFREYLKVFSPLL